MLTPNSLIPSAFQHEVDQGGHIVDVDIALQVAVGIGHVDTCGITGEHIVDQGGHIVDVDILVIVHVATQASVLRGEVARVAGAAVDVGIGLVNMVGIVGRALAAHQAGAVSEHTDRTGHGSRAPTATHIDGPQIGAAKEHVIHNVHIGRVEIPYVKACKTAAGTEHPVHIGQFTGVQVVQSLDGSEIGHIIKPFVCRQRAGTGEEGSKATWATWLLMEL